jgi:LTXXQ motif family protein
MTIIARLPLAAAALAATISLAGAQPATNPSPTMHPGQHRMEHGAAKPGDMGMGHAAAPGDRHAMMEGGMSHMMAMMQMMHGQMMPMDMGLAGMQPVRHIDGQIAFYKAELKITDAQSPQWNAFADALRGSAARLHQTMAHGADAKDVVTAPERMQRRLTMLTAQLDAGQAILAAANPLYAVLTDEQKKVADELMTERMMPMRGGS